MEENKNLPATIFHQVHSDEYIKYCKDTKTGYLIGYDPINKFMKFDCVEFTVIQKYHPIFDGTEPILYHLNKNYKDPRIAFAERQAEFLKDVKIIFLDYDNKK